MTDYRTTDFDYRNPEDPFWRDAKMDPEAGAANAAWGWIAAAMFLVVILAAAFGIGHRPGQNAINTASDVATPPAATHTVPPATVPPPAISSAPAAPAPRLTPAPNTLAPNTLAPNTPEHMGGTQ